MSEIEKINFSSLWRKKEVAKLEMLTKIQRITKLVRVSAEWHRVLKVDAAQNEITISKLLDEVCKHYYGEISTQSQSQHKVNFENAKFAQKPHNYANSNRN